MGSGGSGAGAGGGGYSGGGLANTGGTGYGGDLGGYGTAGEMSGGAGGAGMAGFGNTGAGGSGMAGVSSMSGLTPAGFTPAYGDPRGLSIGMDPYGNYKGTPGYSGIGAPGKPTTMTPKAQMELFGYVKPATPPQTFSTPIPTTTTPLGVRPPQAGLPPPSTARPGDQSMVKNPNSIAGSYAVGSKGPFGTSMGAVGVRRNPGIGDQGINATPPGRGFMGDALGNAPGSGSTGGPNRSGKANQQ